MSLRILTYSWLLCLLSTQFAAMGQVDLGQSPIGTALDAIEEAVSGTSGQDSPTTDSIADSTNDSTKVAATAAAALAAELAAEAAAISAVADSLSAAKSPNLPKNVGEGVKDVTENVGDALDTFTNIVNLRNLLTVIFLIFFTWLLIKLLNWFFDWATERFNQHRLRILRIQPVVFVFVWTVMIYALIETLFHPTQEAVFAVGASSALALGFAAQDILKNIFGGLLILFDRPFQIGDRIAVKGNYGEVTSIGLRTTRIRTLDDSMITIPNAMVMNDGISNANSGALDCMVVVNLWLPIGVNVAQVRKIAYEAAITSRYLNIDKAVVILFFDHFDNEPATNVKVKAYVLDARYEKAFEGDVTEAAKKGFREALIYESK